MHGPSWGGTQEIVAIMCFLGLALKARLRAKLCHARISVGLEFVSSALTLQEVALFKARGLPRVPVTVFVGEEILQGG